MLIFKTYPIIAGESPFPKLEYICGALRKKRFYLQVETEMLIYNQSKQVLKLFSCKLLFYCLGIDKRATVKLRFCKRFLRSLRLSSDM